MVMKGASLPPKSSLITAHIRGSMDAERDKAEKDRMEEKEKIK